MATANPTPVTPPRVAFFDPHTGLVSREWYMFFLSLFNNISNADLVLKGPPITDESGLFASTLQTAQLASFLSQVEQNTLQAAQLSTLFSGLQADLAALQTSVQDLTLAPANTPQLRNRAYGSFYDTTTQTAAAINTAYAMTLNSTDLSNAVYIGSPTSRVYVDKHGIYDIQFSAQLDNTSGGNHLVYIWLRVNGANVANTASQVRLKGTDGELVAAWNFLHQFKPGDYFELMWSVSDTAVQIVAQAAVAPVPAIPSVILTVTDNISAYQD